MRSPRGIAHIAGTGHLSSRSRRSLSSAHIARAGLRG
jgi:hypothetical protein